MTKYGQFFFFSLFLCTLVLYNRHLMLHRPALGKQTWTKTWLQKQLRQHISMKLKNSNMCFFFLFHHALFFVFVKGCARSHLCMFEWDVGLLLMCKINTGNFLKVLYKYYCSGTIQKNIANTERLGVTILKAFTFAFSWCSHVRETR